MDYQNVHLSAHEQFEQYWTPKHEALIHPARYAEQVAAHWSKANDMQLTVDRVFAYRGLPDARKEPKLNSRVSRQHSAWQRDTRVTVAARPLRYPRDWPDEKAQEKGVDVMMALAIVRCALDASCDHIIIATRDTDMLPAIEMAEAERPGSVILATWDGGSVLRLGGSIPTVRLSEAAYRRSRDTNNYS